MLHRPPESKLQQFRSPSQEVVVQQHRTDPTSTFVPQRTDMVTDTKTARVTPSNPPTQASTTSARCPALDLKFLLRLYKKRNEISRKVMDTSERIEIIKNQGFSTGLAKRIIFHADQRPLRIYLVENSSTMYHADGHLVVQSKNPPFSIQLVDCTRWEEVCGTLIWHAELAAWCQTPMSVRLLHDPGARVGPQQMGVAASTHLSSTQEVDRLKGVLQHMGGSCGGSSSMTPLIMMNLREMLQTVLEMSPTLQQETKGMVLVICTDGLPTDEHGKESSQVTKEFTNTLQLLQGQQVSVVIRLYTDEDRVVQFYQQLNHNFESSSSAAPPLGRPRPTFQLHVLDDYVSECLRVHRHNPWLNYGYPLHLCREQGMSCKILDSLHERTLSLEEATVVMGLLFDGRLEQPNSTHTSIANSFFKDPQMDYAGFRKQIEALNHENGVLWNPIPRKFLPWINVKILDKLYDPHRNHKHKGGGAAGESSGCSPCVMS